MVIERYHSLDEGPAVARQVSDYAAKLENQRLVTALESDTPVHHDGEEKPKERTCGLPGFRPDPGTATNFARILQDMIRRSLTRSGYAGSSILSRIRIFEDHTISLDIGEGVSAEFTECRSTQFKRLRSAAGITEEDYCSSLCSRSFLGQSGQGGKSGALFLRSHDELYILKTIEEHEFQCLKEILPNYVLYLEENKESLLCRIFGAYALTMGGARLRVVVMSNVLHGKQLSIYDLKGTTEDRWVDPAQHSVLKDNNFHPYHMKFESDQARRLTQIIQDDAEFLESCGLMDYSLLVGVSAGDNGAVGAALRPFNGWLASQQEPQVPRVFQMGIIDYLQRWTPKKVAAHWLKKYTIGCTHEIDTEPPTKYCTRFYKYFKIKILEKP